MLEERGFFSIAGHRCDQSRRGFMVRIHNLRAASRRFESQKNQWWWQDGHPTLTRFWPPTKSRSLLIREQIPRPRTEINNVEITPWPRTEINTVEITPRPRTEINTVEITPRPRTGIYNVGYKRKQKNSYEQSLMWRSELIAWAPDLSIVLWIFPFTDIYVVGRCPQRGPDDISQMCAAAASEGMENCNVLRLLINYTTKSMHAVIGTFFIHSAPLNGVKSFQKEALWIDCNLYSVLPMVLYRFHFVPEILKTHFNF